MAGSTRSSSTMSSDDGSTTSSAMIELMAPDGYYKYLGVEKPAVPSEAPSPSDADKAPLLPSADIDADLVKKNYRRLSRKHHPDKPGGDADTFRLLNRAQKVLSDPKLRQQYDILGIDLDDDEAEHDHEHTDGEHKETPSTAQGIIQEIAGMAIAAIMQLTVRTAMLAGVAIFVVRYRLLLYPALAFLAFIAFRIFQRSQAVADQSTWDVMSPILLTAGLLSMHHGRTRDADWTKLFWLGESLVIAVFTYNSVSSSLPYMRAILVAIGIFAALAALWFRGRFWNYVIVIAMEAFLAIVVALAFPIIELILEQILNEKLKKVGDKMRQHHRVLEQYYEVKLEEERRSSRR